MDWSWVVGLATLVVTPYAYSLFSTLGAPFDDVFVPNFFHLPLEDRLRPLALPCALALTVVAFAASLRLVARLPGPTLGWIRFVVSALAILFALNFVRSGILFWAPMRDIMALLRAQPVLSAALLSLVLAVIGFAVYRFRERIASFCITLIQAYALVAVVILLNAAIAVVQLWPHLSLQVPLASASNLAPADEPKQFIWMIFDQADHGLIFDRRDPSVELPNFDRLRAQSITATDAHSPGSPTFIAIPSLMMGSLVEVRKGTPDSPEISLGGGFTPLSDAPSILYSLQQSGTAVDMVAQTFDMGAICRTFAASVNSCWQENALRGEAIDLPSQLLREIVVVWKRFLFAMPLVRLAAADLFTDMAGIGVIAPGYIAYTLANTEAVVSARIGENLQRNRLLYVHWMLPHQPFIYDRFENEVVEPLSGPDLDGYLGNLELADRVLGRVLDTLESTGAMDRTALLVTADHGFESLHVPFLLKLPESNERGDISERFDTRSTRQLIDAFFAGALNSTEDVRSHVLP